MKQIVIGAALVLLFAAALFAQTKTITGTVIDYTQGNKGNWEIISVKAGNKTYDVYITSVKYPYAKTVGEVTQVGRMVQIFYTRKPAATGDYAGAIIAAKVVEIGKPPSRKR